MAELQKIDAVVLGAIRWRESSKIVHLYSRELGSIRVIAKGALRPKSPFRGVLETLNHIEAIISSKQTRSLQILTNATLTSSYLQIRDDLEKTAVSFSILEMLAALFSVHEPVEDFFDYSMHLLQQIETNATENNLPFLWHFLYRCADALGFSWNFAKCLNCPKAAIDGPIFLDAANSGFRCGSCRRFAARGQEALSLAEWQALLQFLAHDMPESNTIPDFDAGWLTQLMLRQLIIHTDIQLELKSLKWYM
ncbi:MAG: DNA repair protein RecO [Calditrichota bacterium]